MGEGFGAQEADGGDVGVGGGDEWVGDTEGGGGGFDFSEEGGDVSVRGFGAQEAEDLAGLSTIGLF